MYLKGYLHHPAPPTLLPLLSPLPPLARFALLPVLLVLLTGCGTALAQGAPVPVITTNGEAHLQAAPDRVHIDVGVLTYAADTQVALNENNQRMERVLAAIEALGIARADMETGRFSIQPRFSSSNNNNRDEDPKIVGFTVTNRAMITTGKLELAGRIVASAAEAGANSIGNLRFDLQDSDPLRNQALAQATRNAIADAHTLAAAAGVMVGAITSISTAYATPVAAYEVAAAPMARMAMMAAGPPPIESGTVSVNAQVTVVMQIANQ